MKIKSYLLSFEQFSVIQLKPNKLEFSGTFLNERYIIIDIKNKRKVIGFKCFKLKLF